jgi:hypothetical protein
VRGLNERAGIAPRRQDAIFPQQRLSGTVVAGSNSGAVIAARTRFPNAPRPGKPILQPIVVVAAIASIIVAKDTSRK